MLVLLVEDDPSLAELVIEFFEEEGVECDHTGNGLHAIELITEHRYDVVVLDINLPGCNGLEVCDHLRRYGFATPCIMLTARDSLDDKLAGFDQGADDYLIKPFALPELMARVNALLKRHQHNASFAIGDLVISPEQHQVVRGEEIIQPSPDEWRLLLLLAKASPKVVKRSAIEDHLWPQGVPSDDAFKMAVYRLRKAIERPELPTLLHTVRGVGLALKVQDEKQ
ncbi:MAG: response regulator transcription factor [Pseudomonadales bacterium]|nr:response regulator transcription factor [Pseudomonadales bacterium]